MNNPFEFGRELSNLEIVDRDQEIQEVVRTIHNRGRLFLIGPRRFGKTSILRAAAERARKEGAVVFRYNAEAYPSLTVLAERIVTDAAKELTGPIRKAGRKIQEVFGALQPQLTYDPVSNTFSATLGQPGRRTSSSGRQAEEMLLSDTLAGLNRLAGMTSAPVAVIIDEFQAVVEEGGPKAEGQLRAAVQTHDNVGYVFAGSKTRMLSEMTGDEGRPFYRLGERHFVGPVPREDFRLFIAGGFEHGGLEIVEEAIETILDLSQDVPYNVQRLAHACWNHARESSQTMSSQCVTAVLHHLVSRDDPFYTQTWNRISASQKRALHAIVYTLGTGLFSGDITRMFGLRTPSSMQAALQGLMKAGIAWENEHRGTTRYRLEDPFLAVWITLFTVPPKER